MENSDCVFNLYHIKHDEHGGNKERKNKEGKERTSSCAFHMEQSVKNHKEYVTKESRVYYANLCNSLKHSSTTEIFNSNEALLPSLISNQVCRN